jgi:hypothetical protein
MQRHGLFIGIERYGDDFFLSLRARGRLRREDYEFVGPIIDSALAGLEGQLLRLLVDGSEVERWEASALWADLRLGLKHAKHFSKIAYVGPKRWHRLSGNLAQWFIAGKSRHFLVVDDALAWLLEE